MSPHMLVVITGMLPNAITTGGRSAKTKEHFKDKHNTLYINNYLHLL